MTNFVYPDEKLYFVESIRKFQVIDIGSQQWMDCHEMVIKLSHQAILEAAENREEEVKEMLIIHDKLQTLIHEAFGTFLWKTRVLPYLLDIDPNPRATFFIYTVLFYEGAVISLLDMALYHVSGCEALQDSAIDLIDYCVKGVAQLIGLTNMGHHENFGNVDVDESILSELERQKRDLIYKIGLRCISILNYLVNNTKALPISAPKRFVVTHDVPWLLSDLLHFRPWQRQTDKGLEQFIDDKWVFVQGEDANKANSYEAQTWFCLHQILFNKDIMDNYDLNEERCRRLSSCLGLMQMHLLDQLPPLVEVKEFLTQLPLTAGTSCAGATYKKSNLLLEEIPQIEEALLKEAENCGGFYEIAQKQQDIFLCTNTQKIQTYAHRFTGVYSADLLAELEGKSSGAIPKKRKDSEKKNRFKDHYCRMCLSDADKKCSRCKSVYYCSRKCQVSDWDNHKSGCVPK